MKVLEIFYIGSFGENMDELIIDQESLLIKHLKLFNFNASSLAEYSIMKHSIARGIFYKKII